MKYLKRFNEELRSPTYRNAARLFKNMGHARRASNLDSWATEIEEKEKLKRKQDILNKVKNHGTYDLLITKRTYNPQLRFSSTDQVMTGQFHIGMNIDTDSLSEAMWDYTKWGGHLRLPIELYIVSANIETEEKISSLDNLESYDGAYWLNNFYLLINGKQDCGFDAYDAYGFYFYNRSDANKFKKLMIDTFEGNSDWGKANFHIYGKGQKDVNIENIHQYLMDKHEEIKNYIEKDEPEFELDKLNDLLSKENIMNNIKRNISINRIYIN
jgi:hypothetical protein